MTASVFLGASTLYYNSINKTPKEIESELAFINQNKCVLNNWEIEVDTDKKPLTRLKSLDSTVVSKPAKNGIGYVKLKNHQYFIYECGNNISFESYYGFIDKVSNTKSTNLLTKSSLGL